MPLLESYIFQCKKFTVLFFYFFSIYIYLKFIRIIDNIIVLSIFYRSVFGCHYRFPVFNILFP